MIIHKLIIGFLRHGGGFPEFFLLQAQDAIRWIQKKGVPLTAKTSVLDLGCGFGDFGGELAKRGCQVTLADDDSFVLPEYAKLPFRRVNIDQDHLSTLGTYDLVICSNVFEHLAKPARFIESAHELLKPGGILYLSWTNWLSPWGGHEFSPYHYLGVRRGYQFFTKVLKKKSQHVPFENLFPTHIGPTLREIRQNTRLRIVRIAPRYYPEFSFIMRLPLFREFFAWNCALLIEKSD
jgi:SAM-dependent methyltransferase